jgi:hypothetical protein
MSSSSALFDYEINVTEVGFVWLGRISSDERHVSVSVRDSDAIGWRENNSLNDSETFARTVGKVFRRFLSIQTLN